MYHTERFSCYQDFCTTDRFEHIRAQDTVSKRKRVMRLTEGDVESKTSVSQEKDMHQVSIRRAKRPAGYEKRASVTDSAHNSAIAKIIAFRKADAYLSSFDQSCFGSIVRSYGELNS